MRTVLSQTNKKTNKIDFHLKTVLIQLCLLSLGGQPANYKVTRHPPVGAQDNLL